jgi:hypothetical protein
MVKAVLGRRKGCGAVRHDTRDAYNRSGCRCPAAREDKRVYVLAWTRTPVGRAYQRRVNARRVRKRRTEPTVYEMEKAERLSLVVLYTRRGDSANEIGVRLDITARSVQRYRAILRAQGRLPALTPQLTSGRMAVDLPA